MRIEPGTITDYDALGALHYRSGRPATHVRTLVARAPTEPAPVGVLVVSMPTLNARWRNALWPGVFTHPNRRERARQINRELRTISRVVIEPRYRGRGLGVALVRAYLHNPLTVRTESVAAMGAWCGFFTAAHMRSVTLDPSPRDANLLVALRRAEIEPWQLADPARVRTLLTRAPGLTDALRRWANASRATRTLKNEHPMRIARAAARTLGARMIAYGHDAV